MAIQLHKIFQYLPRLTPEQEEEKKVSYWLKKLFYQQEEKKDRENKERIEQSQSKPQTPTVSTVNKIKNNSVKLENARINKEDIQNIPTASELDIINMKRMVKSSSRIHISASSVFPFDLFPTTINVEDTRVTVIHKQLLSSQTRTVEMKDISNVLLDSGMFFSTLKIISRTFVQNEMEINKLWNKDAQLIHKVIEGFRKFDKEKIDIAHFSTEELINKMNEMNIR